MAPDGAIIGTVEADRALRIEVVLNWLEELKQRVPTK
jgi:hypothetical protein